jgi:uncharacterized membrane protein
MKRPGIAFVILLALACAALTPAGQKRFSPRARASQTSRIVGTVLDKNESRIIGAVVKIENAQFSRTAASDEEGVFEVEVPAGTYLITVEMEGFKKFELSSFRAKADARKRLSIHMEVKPPASTIKIQQALF